MFLGSVLVGRGYVSSTGNLLAVDSANELYSKNPLLENRHFLSGTLLRHYNFEVSMTLQDRKTSKMFQNGGGIFQEKAPAEIRGDFSELRPRWILQGIFVDFSGLFLGKKTGGKISTQIRIWEFRGQNPHCNDLTLRIFGQQTYWYYACKNRQLQNTLYYPLDFRCDAS